MDTRQSRQRSAAGSNLRWNRLPQHLMDVIFTKVEAEGGMTSVAIMRLVSKAWLAAFKEHPWKLEPKQVRKFRDLQKLCKMIPNMSSLTLSNLEVHVRLAPLSVLSGLTELKVRGDNLPGWGSGQLFVNLSGLPKSLLKLQLSSIDVPPLCLLSLGLVNLRSLSYYDRTCRFYAFPVLLENLSNLEELEAGGYGPDILDVLRGSSGGGYPRCQNLTRLRCYSGYVAHIKDAPFKTLPGLQSISFSNTNLSTDSLNVINQATPGLTFLHLDDCAFVKEGPLIATGSLRSLVLVDVDIPYTLSLADGKLQSLTLRIQDSEKCHQPTLRDLARLTGLTRLELEGWYYEDMTGSLGGLQLEELVVIDCGDRLPQLFEPGTLTALKKLHVESETHTSSFDEQRPRLKQELEKAGSIVSRLPQLCQVSGVGDIFAVHMSQTLKGWHRADMPAGTMSSNRNYHLLGTDGMKIWSKPER